MVRKPREELAMIYRGSEIVASNPLQEVRRATGLQKRN
jgi:hypothetical protein